MAGVNAALERAYRNVATERDIWKIIAAKLAFMVIDNAHPDDTQDDKERMAAGLLAGALEKEQG